MNGISDKDAAACPPANDVISGALSTETKKKTSYPRYDMACSEWGEMANYADVYGAQARKFKYYMYCPY